MQPLSCIKAASYTLDKFTLPWFALDSCARNTIRNLKTSTGNVGKRDANGQKPILALIPLVVCIFHNKSNVNTNKGKGPVSSHRHAECITSQENIRCLCHSLPFLLFFYLPILSSAITAAALMHSPSVLPYYNYGCIMEIMSFSENTASQHHLRPDSMDYQANTQ